MPFTLVVRRAEDETERLVAHLQRELADEARVHATELPTVEGTTIEVEFLDSRRPEEGERRIRELLDAGLGDWAEFVRFADPSEVVHENAMIQGVTPGEDGPDSLGFRVHVGSDTEEQVVIEACVTGSAHAMLEGEVEDFVEEAVLNRLAGYPNDGRKLARLAAEQPHVFDSRHVRQ